MNWLETFRTGWDAVRAHRLRSGLTVLGILIGIAAVVLTVWAAVAMTTDATYFWPIWPLLGGAIGLVSHARSIPKR